VTSFRIPNACLQRFCVPAGNESRQHSLITSRRDTEEIDDRYLVLIGLAKPPLVGRVRILTHEGVVDGRVAFEYLTIHFTLIVVPNLTVEARPIAVSHELRGEKA